jgi:hypothetical protein
MTLRRGQPQLLADASEAYESPALEELGTVQELTQQDKKFGQSDGFTFLGISITNSSQ